MKNRQVSSSAIFREEQRFTQPWLWALLLGGLAVSLAAAYPLIVKFQQIDCPGPLSLWLSIVFPPTLMLLIITLFALTRLATEVRPEGIAVTFRPLQFQPKLIPFSEIADYQSVTYRPILEYGGWGIRRGRTGYAYNVSGNRGLLLTLKGGKTFLIGSQQPERLKAAMDSAFRSRPVG